MADRQEASTIADEGQKLPSILDEVHRLIERLRFRFDLTGSSALKDRESKSLHVCELSQFPVERTHGAVPGLARGLHDETVRETERRPVAELRNGRRHDLGFLKREINSTACRPMVRRSSGRRCGCLVGRSA